MRTDTSDQITATCFSTQPSQQSQYFLLVQFFLVLHLSCYNVIYELTCGLFKTTKKGTSFPFLRGVHFSLGLLLGGKKSASYLGNLSGKMHYIKDIWLKTPLSCVRVKKRKKKEKETCFTDMTLLFATINNAIHFISSYSHCLDILNIFSYFFILQNKL